MESKASPCIRSNSKFQSYTCINLKITDSPIIDTAPSSPFKQNKLRKSPTNNQKGIKFTSQSKCIPSVSPKISSFKSSNLTSKYNSLDTTDFLDSSFSKLIQFKPSIHPFSPKSNQQKIIETIQNISHKPIAIQRKRFKSRKNLLVNKKSVTSILQTKPLQLNYSSSQLNPFRQDFLNISHHQILPSDFKDYCRQSARKLHISTKPKVSKHNLSVESSYQGEHKMCKLNRSTQNIKKKWHEPQSLIQKLNTSYTESVLYKPKIKELKPLHKRKKLSFKSDEGKLEGEVGENLVSICSWNALETSNEHFYVI